MELRLEKRLSPKMEGVLNEWLKLEFGSSHLYKSMAAWADDYGYNGLFKLYQKYSSEELEHYNKVYEYMCDKNCKPIVPDVPKMDNKYSFKEVLEKSLEHEILVTDTINKITNAACDEKDMTTFFFTEWFVKEQIEEEVKFRDLLDRLAMLGDNQFSYGFLDNEILKNF